MAIQRGRVIVMRACWVGWAFCFVDCVGGHEEFHLQKQRTPTAVHFLQLAMFNGSTRWKVRSSSMLFEVLLFVLGTRLLDLLLASSHDSISKKKKKREREKKRDKKSPGRSSLFSPVSSFSLDEYTHWYQPDVAILIKHIRTANNLRVVAASQGRHLHVDLFLFIDIIPQLIKVLPGVDPHKRPADAWSCHCRALVGTD